MYRHTHTHKRWKVATNKFARPPTTSHSNLKPKEKRHIWNQATKPTRRECSKWLPCGTHKTYLGLHKLCNITTISNIYMVEPYWMRWINMYIRFALTRSRTHMHAYVQTYPKICDIFPSVPACLPSCLPASRSVWMSFFVIKCNTCAFGMCDWCMQVI